MDFGLKKESYGYDLVLRNGDIALVDGGFEEVEQRILNRLLIYQNEWFLFDQGGIDWVGDILQAPIDSRIPDDIIRAEIADIEGVDRVVSVVSSQDTSTRKKRFVISVIVDGELFTTEIEQ